jgi:hypothetical protein
MVYATPPNVTFPVDNKQRTGCKDCWGSWVPQWLIAKLDQDFQRRRFEWYDNSRTRNATTPRHMKRVSTVSAPLREAPKLHFQPKNEGNRLKDSLVTRHGNGKSCDFRWSIIIF